MKRHRKPNGFTLVETLIALVIAVLVVGIPVAVIANGGKGLQRQQAVIHATSDLDLLTTQLKNSAHTAISVYTPATCGGSGSGDGTACSQIRFYGKDSNGISHFWGWNFNGGNVQECLSYTGPEDANCATPGQSVPAAAFAATPTEPGRLATAKQVDPNATADFVTTEYNVLGTAADPAQRVVAGNRVVVVNFGNQYVQREVHLLQGGAPFTTSVLHGAFESPTIGTLGLVAASLSEQVGGAAQIATATEPNYATYQQYIAPGPYWTVTPCVSTTGQTLANVTATGSGLGNSDTYSIAPIAVGTCTYTVSTYDQTAIGTVQVAAPPTPTPPTPAPTCPAGDTGTYPACVAPTATPSCPAGDTGTYPACVAPPTAPPNPTAPPATAPPATAPPATAPPATPKPPTAPPATPKPIAPIIPAPPAVPAIAGCGWSNAVWAEEYSRPAVTGPGNYVASGWARILSCQASWSAGTIVTGGGTGKGKPSGYTTYFEDEGYSDTIYLARGTSGSPSSVPEATSDLYTKACAGIETVSEHNTCFQYNHTYNPGTGTYVDTYTGPLTWILRTDPATELFTYGLGGGYAPFYPPSESTTSCSIGGVGCYAGDEGLTSAGVSRQAQVCFKQVYSSGTRLCPGDTSYPPVYNPNPTPEPVSL